MFNHYNLYFIISEAFTCAFTGVGVATLLLLGGIAILSLLNQRNAVQLKAQTMLATLVDQMHVGVLLLGPHLEIRLSNPAACELLGIKSSQILGKTAFDSDWQVIYEDGTPFTKDTFPVLQVYGQSAGYASAYACSAQNIVIGVKHAIAQRWLLVNAEPQFGADGNIEQVICTLSDITKRKQEEQARQTCERHNQQLEDLICTLSHDLRTPLLAIRATVHSMLKGAFGPVSNTWKDVLEDCRSCNEDILKLVDALLEISRYEVGGSSRLNYEAINWEKIFMQTTSQLNAIQERKCNFISKISATLPTVYGDHLAIQRVVQNLLENAVRFDKQDLQIIFEVLAIEANKVQVFIHDNGPGIATQEKERLFQRFIQGRGRRGRTGLGLYLCRQIVEAHGGAIDFESTLGGGSTFWFTLPNGTYLADTQQWISTKTSVKQENTCSITI